MDIGDERPIEFVLELQRLAADATVDDFLKRIFLRCLPDKIVTAITGSLGGKLKSVAVAADRALTASSSASASTVAVVAPRVATVSVSTKGGRRGGRQRGGKTSGGQTTMVALCDFHKKFGDAARRCVPACSRWNEDWPRDNPASRVLQVTDALDGEDADIGSAVSGNE